MKCFIIMPFADEFDTVKEAIKTAVTNTNNDYFRADEYYKVGKISEQICFMIDESDVCICDITKNNPNVIWELGYAYSKNKKVILIAQDTKEIFFDIKIERTIIYDKNNIKNSLIQRLEVFLSSINRDIINQSIEEYFEKNHYKGYGNIIGSPHIDNTPFSYFNIRKFAKNHIFIAAQDHYFLTKNENRERYKNSILEFLVGNPDRKIDIMITDERERNKFSHKTWQYVTADRFIDDLYDAIKFYKDLFISYEKIESKKGILSIHKVLFIPITISFIDPEEENGFLIISPNAYEDEGMKRPFYAFSKRRNEEMFIEYWSPYKKKYEEIKKSNILE